MGMEMVLIQAETEEMAVRLVVGQMLVLFL